MTTINAKSNKIKFKTLLQTQIKIISLLEGIVSELTEIGTTQTLIAYKTNSATNELQRIQKNTNKNLVYIERFYPIMKDLHKFTLKGETQIVQEGVVGTEESGNMRFRRAEIRCPAEVPKFCTIKSRHASFRVERSQNAHVKGTYLGRGM